MSTIYFQVVKDPLFELGITLCIVLNTLFLALEHHGMSNDVRYALDVGNKVSWKYFQNNSNFALLLFNISTGIYISFYIWMCSESNGTIKRVFSVWLEYIRLNYSISEFIRFNIWVGWRFKCIAWIKIGKLLYVINRK